MKNFNIVIPMSGFSKRFFDAGYQVPKFLIDINGKPMIQHVVESINLKGQYIFIVLKEHYEKYRLDKVLNKIVPNCIIIQIDKVTEGAALTVLKSECYINNDNPLIVCNSDQIFEYDKDIFLKKCEDNWDGIILTFKSDGDKKWSYIECDKNNVITRAEEKIPLKGNIATVGMYYYNKGSEFVKYAKQMIDKNIRTNKEFYVLPVFQQYLLDNKNLLPFLVKKFFGVGTPEDLDIYFKRKYEDCDTFFRTH